MIFYCTSVALILSVLFYTEYLYDCSIYHKHPILTLLLVIPIVPWKYLFIKNTELRMKDTVLKMKNSVLNKVILLMSSTLLIILVYDRPIVKKFIVNENFEIEKPSGNDVFVYYVITKRMNTQPINETFNNFYKKVKENKGKDEIFYDFSGIKITDVTDFNDRLDNIKFSKLENVKCFILKTSCKRVDKFHNFKSPKDEGGFKEIDDPTPGEKKDVYYIVNDDDSSNPNKVKDFENKPDIKEDIYDYEADDESDNLKSTKTCSEFKTSLPPSDFTPPPPPGSIPPPPPLPPKVTITTNNPNSFGLDLSKVKLKTVSEEEKSIKKPLGLIEELINAFKRRKGGGGVSVNPKIDKLTSNKALNDLERALMNRRNKVAHSSSTESDDYSDEMEMPSLSSNNGFIKNNLKPVPKWGPNVLKPVETDELSSKLINQKKNIKKPAEPVVVQEKKVKLILKKDLISNKKEDTAEDIKERVVNLFGAKLKKTKKPENHSSQSETEENGELNKKLNRRRKTIENKSQDKIMSSTSKVSDLEKSLDKLIVDESPSNNLLMNEDHLYPKIVSSSECEVSNKLIVDESPSNDLLMNEDHLYPKIVSSSECEVSNINLVETNNEINPTEAILNDDFVIFSEEQLKMANEDDSVNEPKKIEVDDSFILIDLESDLAVTDEDKLLNSTNNIIQEDPLLNVFENYFSDSQNKSLQENNLLTVQQRSILDSQKESFDVEDNSISDIKTDSPNEINDLSFFDDQRDYLSVSQKNILPDVHDDSGLGNKDDSIVEIKIDNLNQDSEELKDSWLMGFNDLEIEGNQDLINEDITIVDQIFDLTDSEKAGNICTDVVEYICWDNTLKPSAEAYQKSISLSSSRDNINYGGSEDEAYSSTASTIGKSDESDNETGKSNEEIKDAPVKVKTFQDEISKIKLKSVNIDERIRKGKEETSKNDNCPKVIKSLMDVISSKFADERSDELNEQIEDENDSGWDDD